jgi:two-component system sensor histidine kinase KdpD
MIWGLALIAAFSGMLLFRDRLDKAHVALGFLLIVLGGSARGGRALGLTLAAVAFLVFNWFFVEPHGTLIVANPLDWLVLVTFLITSIVAAQLLSVARAETLAASRRADEVDRLAALGAETLNAGRAEDALTAIASVVRSTLGVTVCEVYLRSDDGALTIAARDGPIGDTQPPNLTHARLVQWVAEHGSGATERADGTIRVAWERDDTTTLPAVNLDLTDARAVLLPLRVRDRTVGVMRIAASDAFSLDSAQWRFVNALSYYAALGAERVRLTREAGNAEALREADRLKDALIASVSHDLRTPLTTIKALAHDLRSLGDDRVETIELEADRLNRFVADLLDLSRLSAGSLPLRIELNAVDDLVGVVIQQTLGIMKDRHLDVALDGDPAQLFARFDLVHSVRVLVNLIENACKYSPAGAPIVMRVRREGAMIALSVADQGPGVPASERTRIFAPFYRPDGVPADSGSAGLGLSIARRLAEAQGGHLEYEHMQPVGSTFTLRLPAADIEEVASESL